MRKVLGLCFLFFSVLSFADEQSIQKNAGHSIMDWQQITCW